MLGGQALTLRFTQLRDSFVAAYRNGNREEAESLAAQMQALMADIAAITACDPQFRLDRWLRAAESFAATPEEKDYYRHNAWLLITIWGEDAPPLNDYACRLWSGLVRNYYAPRWNLFTDTILNCMADGSAFSQEAFEQACRELEVRLVSQAPMVDDGPVGDVTELCRNAYAKYFE